MQYSPKLKKAAEEIKVILKKYDIGAHVVLHTPGHSEFILYLTPSYSCVKMLENGIRIRAKKSDFDGNTALRDKRLSDTTNMLHCLATVGGKTLLSLMEISDDLDKITGAEHNGSGFSSNEQQNN